ncbi:MAG TPA: universal stress protein [Pirellulales bacterium]|jgi:nucleotide-binding universal stress UspA family protein|nr:universal stress protein [Pirellulales bacterium]
MERSVLVPLDGSPFGEQALPAAVSIARRLGARLDVVEVFIPYDLLQSNMGWTSVEVLGEIDGILKCRAENYVKHTVSRLAADRTVQVEGAVTSGFIVEGILRQVERTRPELIVMTTHGRGPLSRFWLGSTADQVMRHATVPVLLIRPREAAPEPSADPLAGRMLIALDGFPLAEEILGPAASLGIPGQTHFCLLRVVQPPSYPFSPLAVESTAPLIEFDSAMACAKAREYLEQIAARLRAKRFEVSSRVVIDPSPASAIIEQSGAQACGAIAITTHARHGLPRLIIGSVADKVVRGATVPVLLNRGNGER